jgi:glucose/arabinose dehydrogenase
MLGKLLQINPASGQARVYSRGLRNPYRFSFDLVTDPSQPRVAIGDVGEHHFEEIDYLTLAAADGANFGWNDFEGFAPFPGAHPPIATGTVRPIKVYSSAGSACAVIGGYVVRDARLPSLFHRYVYGDLCTGKIRSLVPALGGARRDRGTGLRVRDLSSFGEGPDGSLYAASLDGPVYRFVRRR